MGFVKSLAKGGLFGLAGLAASGAFKNKKKETPAPKSLVAGDYNSNPGGGSLIGNKSIY